MSIKGRIAVIKTSIYRMLIRHPFLDALQYTIRNYNNHDVCRDIAGRNGMRLVCSSYGGANKDKNIYHICFGKAGNGFFAQFRFTLKYLLYADRFGFVPVIEWSDELPYAEDYMVNGTNNVFEYYFEQPSEISVEEMHRSYNVFEAEEIHITDFFLKKEMLHGENGYEMSEDYMDELAKIMKKYIRLNAKTQRYIKTSIADLLGRKKTIGVHYRGSDYKNNYNEHPTASNLMDYIVAVKEVVELGEYEQIFVATDDEEALNGFVKEFGDKLAFYADVARTKGNTSVAFSESEREKHHYLLGLEVLRDMYTLAMCDGLVAGLSQVSNCARIAKKSNDQAYKDVRILNSGINHNGNVFVR